MQTRSRSSRSTGVWPSMPVPAVLELEAATRPRLQIGRDADPADQLLGVGEHVEYPLRWCGQDELMDHRVAVDHYRASFPDASSPDCRAESRLPQNSFSIACSCASRSARAR